MPPPTPPVNFYARFWAVITAPTLTAVRSSPRGGGGAGGGGAPELGNSGSSNGAELPWQSGLAGNLSQKLLYIIRDKDIQNSCKSPL